jgi:hypothetical protein
VAQSSSMFRTTVQSGGERENSPKVASGRFVGTATRRSEGGCQIVRKNYRTHLAASALTLIKVRPGRRGLNGARESSNASRAMQPRDDQGETG